MVVNGARGLEYKEDRASGMNWLGYAAGDTPGPEDAAFAMMRVGVGFGSPSAVERLYQKWLKKEIKYRSEIPSDNLRRYGLKVLPSVDKVGARVTQVAAHSDARILPNGEVSAGAPWQLTSTTRMYFVRAKNVFIYVHASEYSKKLPFDPDAAVETILLRLKSIDARKFVPEDVNPFAGFFKKFFERRE